MDNIDLFTLNYVGDYLSENNLKLFIGESMTGGFLGSVLSLQIDSGRYFLGGIISYATQAKQSLLHVNPHNIERYTAESSEITLEMLNGLKHLITADIYVAITGMAFADSSSKHTAEVGDIFIAISFKGVLVNRTVHCIDCNPSQIYISAVNNVFHELFLIIKRMER